MLPIAVDTALNLIWLSIGVATLAFFGCREALRHRRSTLRARCLRLTAVFVLTVALFPSVSSSDDLFNFSYLNTHLGKHGGFGNTVPEDSREKAGFQLFRLLETISHFQISHAYTLSLALCCVALVLTTRRTTVPRAVLCRAGRAPPSL